MKRNVSFTLVFLLVVLLFNGPASASYTVTKNTQYTFGVIDNTGGALWYPIYTLSQKISGDYSIDPGFIYVSYIDNSGVIKSYQLYPFEQAVIVSEGRLEEASLPDFIIRLSYWNNNLVPYSIIYDPADKPWWGGEMRVDPTVFMNQYTANYNHVWTHWHSGGAWPTDKEIEENFMFYSYQAGGWQ